MLSENTSKKNKKVAFNETNEIYTTYGKSEYDRFQIDSIIYQKSYNKISDTEWNNIHKEVNKYKQCEMVVHINSVKNTALFNRFN